MSYIDLILIELSERTNMMDLWCIPDFFLITSAPLAGSIIPFEDFFTPFFPRRSIIRSRSTDIHGHRSAAQPIRGLIWGVLLLRHSTYIPSLVDSLATTFHDIRCYRSSLTDHHQETIQIACTRFHRNRTEALSALLALSAIYRGIHDCRSGCRPVPLSMVVLRRLRRRTHIRPQEAWLGPSPAINSRYR